MKALNLFLSPSGRIAPKPFAFGVILVYAASFLSQILISPPMSADGGAYAFAVVQIALIWMWYALHAKRLHDAGLPTAAARAICLLYALAMVLLALLVEPILGPDPSTVGVQSEPIGFSDLWVFFLLIAALGRPSDVGIFYIFSLGTLMLILVPIAIAIGYSIWTGARPTKIAAAPAS